MNSDITLIFNGLTGALLNLDKKAKTLYDQISKGNQPMLDYPDAAVDIEKLKKHRLVIDDDVDELEYIKVMYRLQMFQTDLLTLTIAPTLACNFRCTYCYETQQSNRITPDIQAKIIEFIEQRLQSTNTLIIMWYGGEPLLEKKILEEMSKQMMADCKKYGVHYNAGIVTNGYLLDKETAHTLREYGIASAQVTLDGPKEIHDARRMLINGKGTFDKILANLTDVIDIIPLIKIRVNIDQMNVEKIGELFDTFSDHGLQQKIQIYYAPVVHTTKVCQDMVDADFSNNAFSNVEVELFKTTMVKGYKMLKYPQPMLGGCAALHLNSFLLDPSGNIYKCWKTIGIEEERLGTIGAPIEFTKNNLKWLSWDPFVFKKCNTCNLLPVCMGGCPYKFIMKQVQEPECMGWKKNIQEMIQLFYQSRHSQNGAFKGDIQPK